MERFQNNNRQHNSIDDHFDSTSHPEDDEGTYLMAESVLNNQRKVELIEQRHALEEQTDSRNLVNAYAGSVIAGALGASVSPYLAPIGIVAAVLVYRENKQKRSELQAINRELAQLP